MLRVQDVDPFKAHDQYDPKVLTLEVRVGMKPWGMDSRIYTNLVLLLQSLPARVVSGCFLLASGGRRVVGVGR